jgi:hypothetical protein
MQEKWTLDIQSGEALIVFKNIITGGIYMPNSGRPKKIMTIPIRNVSHQVGWVMCSWGGWVKALCTQHFYVKIIDPYRLSLI